MRRRRTRRARGTDKWEVQNAPRKASLALGLRVQSSPSGTRDCPPRSPFSPSRGALFVYLVPPPGTFAGPRCRCGLLSASKNVTTCRGGRGSCHGSRHFRAENVTTSSFVDASCHVSEHVHGDPRVSEGPGRWRLWHASPMVAQRYQRSGVSQERRASEPLMRCSLVLSFI